MGDIIGPEGGIKDGKLISQLPQAFTDVSADYSLPAGSVYARRVDVTFGGSITVSGVTVANGADATEGFLADAAIITDASGTVSGKLRGLVKMLADMWDSVNHRLRVDGSGVTQPVSADALPLPTGAALEAGGNLAALVAAQQPFSDQGTLSLQGDTWVFPIPAGYAGANCIVLSGAIPSTAQIVVQEAVDAAGTHFTGGVHLFDRENDEQWFDGVLPNWAVVGGGVGRAFDLHFTTGATAIRFSLLLADATTPVVIRVTATPRSNAPPLYIAGMAEGDAANSGFLAVVGGVDPGSRYPQPLRVKPDGTIYTQEAPLSDGAQGNLWLAATTGAGGFSDPYTVTQGTTVAIVGHVSGATTISLQFSQDGTNFYTATLPAPVSATGDFSFLATIPLNWTLRLQSSNSVTATATVGTSN